MSSQQPNGLTPKQDRFCREYLVDLNATQAAIRAGYSEKTAKQQGSRLLTNADVQTRISELQDEVRQRIDVKVDDVIARLIELSEKSEAAGQFAPAVRAAELLGKRLGMFVNRLEVSETAAMSDEQLIRQVAGDDEELAARLRAKVGRDSFDA
jgi:phage terminase small subunit